MFLSYTTTLNAAIDAGIVNEYINMSKTRDNDIYNERGINITAQQRRQRLFDILIYSFTIIIIIIIKQIIMKMKMI
jgi:hypothetical protein